MVEIERLFRLHSAAVYRYAHKALRGDTVQAEDIVQQVFVAVTEQYGRDFFGISDQHAQQLIMKIAARRVIDVRRKQAASRSNGMTPLDDAVLPAVDKTGSALSDPADRVASHDAIRRFWFAVSRELTDTEYQVALLAWALQRPDEEIAAALAVTVSTVYSHKSRARRKIRHIMEGAGIQILFPSEERFIAPGYRVLGARAEGEVQA
ncbi:RNA polymerase sigma factor [Nocardia goodfellowii]|uniref:RNA polymerase sigma factor (Sigma-70 family) n=1 Tax=Nocardia goodfellowii TaxID=882446 RepID=A0ABS4QFX0_9NOCA|nr:sigma-70 family RNA polymerase sigma factor [Nocardia goodfellowii]MBP2190590.1 RNA polymerase sigma factor (sigma-70 family) [Nocardia goodfellowii]